MKPGESRVSEGPKNERTELNEKLESQTEQSAEAVGSGNCGHYPKGKALARRCGRRHPERASWQGPRGSARLNTESEVREPEAWVPHAIRSRGHRVTGPLRSTVGCGKPHVRWCGRVQRRNPMHPTRSFFRPPKRGAGWNFNRHPPPQHARLSAQKTAFNPDIAAPLCRRPKPG